MPKKKKEESAETPHEIEEVLELHDFAKAQYTEANAEAEKVQDLITKNFQPYTDATDTGDVTVTRPVRARAIIERIRQMMQINTLTYSVVPLKAGDVESAACTKLERWLTGYKRRLKHETKKDVDRDAAFWYLLRGRAFYEVRFRPDLVGSDKLPIRMYADDPISIFPVYGEDGILYYTKERSVYGRELKEVLEDAGEPTEIIEESNDKYDCIEYWDDTYYALIIKGEKESKLVWSKEHDYGFVPLSEARCLDTPLDDARFAYGSIIAPVVEHIKQVYILASKMATGVNLFYYPLIFYKSQTGIPTVFNPSGGNAGIPEAMPADAKWEVLNPQVNSALMQQLMSFYLSDIYLTTVPEVAFGQEPQNLQSGFAISQVLGGVASAILDKLPQLEMAASDAAGNVLRLVEQFAPADGVDLMVPVDYED